MRDEPGGTPASRHLARQSAERREARLREIVREHLPRGLRWAERHIRLLRLIYRLRPAWKPDVAGGTDLGVTVVCVSDRRGRVYVVTEQQVRDAG